MMTNSIQTPGRRLSLAEAAAHLRDGGVVGIPTETVYGLAADAFNALAVARVFEVKSRPRFDPLIVHIASIDMLDRVTLALPEAAVVLANRFWPGPLTMVLPKHETLPELVTAGLDTVAVRLPAHPMARALIEATGTPLAAPSANPFGGISPTQAVDVLNAFGDRIDGVVDGGPCAVGIESTIVGLFGSRRVLLRPGGVDPEAIEACIGPLERYQPGHDRDLPAPGMLPRHYAPRTPLSFFDARRPRPPGRVGWLGFGHSAPPPDCAVAMNLDPDGNLVRAAANLYHLLRQLDALELSHILVAPPPESGLGIAINDRLRRAAMQA